MDRAPVVGVMGGGDVPEQVEDQAAELGRRIAERGWVLLNGGRDAGVMAASALAAQRADGVVLGVLPDRDASRAADGVTYALATGLGEARNLVNVLSSDVVLACRGGAGTLSEVALAVNAGTPTALVDWPDDEAPQHLEDAGLARIDSPREAITWAQEQLEA